MVQMVSRGFAPAHRIVVGAVAVAVGAVHGASCFARDGQNVAGVRTFAATAAWCVIVCGSCWQTFGRQGTMCEGGRVVLTSADKKRRCRGGGGREEDDGGEER